MVQRYGSKVSFKSRVQKHGSKAWFKSMVQNIVQKRLFKAKALFKIMFRNPSRRIIQSPRAILSKPADNARIRTDRSKHTGTRPAGHGPDPNAKRQTPQSPSRDGTGGGLTANASK